MWRLLLALIISGFPGFAAAEETEERSCRELLFSPRFEAFLDPDNGLGSGLLASDWEGRALLGTTCREQDLTEYFEGGGWEFVEKRRRRADGPYGVDPVFYRDTTIVYCRRGRGLFTFYLKSCVQSASIFLLQGKITNIAVGAVK